MHQRIDQVQDASGWRGRGRRARASAERRGGVEDAKLDGGDAARGAGGDAIANATPAEGMVRVEREAVRKLGWHRRRGGVGVRDGVRMVRQKAHDVSTWAKCVHARAGPSDMAADEIIIPLALLDAKYGDDALAQRSRRT